MPSSRWLPSAWRTWFHWAMGSLVQSAGARAPGPLGAQELDHLGQLDAGPEDGPEGDEVRVGAAVRLGIGVGGAEELAGAGVGQVLDRVDVVAAGVEPVMGDALGVLVGQQVGHGALGRQRRVVLAGDQLDVAPLVGQLLDDRPGHLGGDPGHGLEVGEVGQESRRDVARPACGRDTSGSVSFAWSPSGSCPGGGCRVGGRVPRSRVSSVPPGSL